MHESKPVYGRSVQSTSEQLEVSVVFSKGGVNKSSFGAETFCVLAIVSGNESHSEDPGGVWFPER